MVYLKYHLRANEINYGGIVIDKSIRLHLKAACYFFGGQKAVAHAAGVDNSNFGKWLTGGAKLSDVKVDLILDVMGIPGLKPSISKVHVWNVKKLPGSLITSLDFANAASLYFPDGGKIAKAMWVGPGLEPIKRIVLLRQPKSVYALTDGHCRAVLRLAAPMALQKGQVKPPFLWRDGKEEDSILNISDIQEQWLSGTPTLAEFDVTWNDKRRPLTRKDLILAVRQEGITYCEAVGRILENRKS